MRSEIIDQLTYVVQLSNNEQSEYSIALCKNLMARKDLNEDERFEVAYTFAQCMTVMLGRNFDFELFHIEYQYLINKCLKKRKTSNDHLIVDILIEFAGKFSAHLANNQEFIANLIELHQKYFPVDQEHLDWREKELKLLSTPDINKKTQYLTLLERIDKALAENDNLHLGLKIIIYPWESKYTLINRIGEIGLFREITLLFTIKEPEDDSEYLEVSHEVAGKIRQWRERIRIIKAAVSIKKWSDIFSWLSQEEARWKSISKATTLESTREKFAVEAYRLALTIIPADDADSVRKLREAYTIFVSGSDNDAVLANNNSANALLAGKEIKSLHERIREALRNCEDELRIFLYPHESKYTLITLLCESGLCREENALEAAIEKIKVEDRFYLEISKSIAKSKIRAWDERIEKIDQAMQKGDWDGVFVPIFTEICSGQQTRMKGNMPNEEKGIKLLDSARYRAERLIPSHKIDDRNALEEKYKLYLSRIKEFIGRVSSNNAAGDQNNFLNQDLINEEDESVVAYIECFSKQIYSHLRLPSEQEPMPVLKPGKKADSLTIDFNDKNLAYFKAVLKFTNLSTKNGTFELDACDNQIKSFTTTRVTLISNLLNWANRIQFIAWHVNQLKTHNHDQLEKIFYWIEKERNPLRKKPLIAKETALIYAESTKKLARKILMHKQCHVGYLATIDALCSSYIQKITANPGKFVDVNNLRQTEKIPVSSNDPMQGPAVVEMPELTRMFHKVGNGHTHASSIFSKKRKSSEDMAKGEETKKDTTESSGASEKVTKKSKMFAAHPHVSFFADSVSESEVSTQSFQGNSAMVIDDETLKVSPP